MSTLSKLCEKMINLLAWLLIEVIILVQKLGSSRSITTKQYLNLIEKKNPTIRYSIRLKGRESECRVCLSEFQEGEKLRKLICQHTFHRDCLDKWLQLQQHWATCPLCRKQVVPHDVVFKHRLHHHNQSSTTLNSQLPFFI
ncbi:hypothetical protein VNO78_28355 [Psophocarpus tetragonolobus]|uniref:RING-type domain-containing protein n=1 Tax=Psophocarpus tetragonolobus TaxID=3891 RepID=A0AAN9S231_PSOTE